MDVPEVAPDEFSELRCLCSISRHQQAIIKYVVQLESISGERMTKKIVKVKLGKNACTTSGSYK